MLAEGNQIYSLGRKGAEIDFMESSSEIHLGRYQTFMVQPQQLGGACYGPMLRPTWYCNLLLSALLCSRCAFEAHMAVNLGLSQVIMFRSSLP